MILQGIGESNMWSVGSGKLLGIPSLNTDTPSNKFCQGMYNSKQDNLICRECYSMSMLKTFRKNCRPKFINNSKFLSEKIHPREYLPPCPSSTGRFHSHGELINSIHLENILNICLNQPITTFTLWTKRKNIVNRVLKNIDKPPANTSMYLLWWGISGTSTLLSSYLPP